jgi:hypothetical protein
MLPAGDLLSPPSTIEGRKGASRPTIGRRNIHCAAQAFHHDADFLVT